MDIKKKAIKLAIEYCKKAITFKSRVGACLYTNRKLFPGYNIENKVHKGYHAEELALINSILNNVNPNDLKGIIITYEMEEDKIYPTCASCRQWLWEFTNPDLLVTVVDLNGNIKYENTLSKLYPLPFPKRRWYEESYLARQAK